MDDANRRIAHNTIYMYVRLLTMVVAGLYTSRLVLALLGVSDFGLFSVVGGLMVMLTFVTIPLANATSRFLNVEMSRPDGEVARCFHVAVTIHAALALLTLVVAETAGLWYVSHCLRVEPGKEADALFVYQVALVTACMGIANAPYQSLFQAHERFKFLALLDTATTLLRLGLVALLLGYEGSYALRLYSLIYSLTTLCTLAVYLREARRCWPDVVRLRWVGQWKYYKKMLAYCGWNVVTSFAIMGRSSGADLLINSFFGTGVNGAFAISKSVGTYVTTFSNNFDRAAAPQIISAYAQRDMQRVSYLANKTGRFNLLLFEVIFFSLWVELDYVLGLWLGHVPEGASLFVRIYLLVAGVALSSGGLSHVVRAYDDVKWFQIEQSTFYLLCIPIGYGLYGVGFPPPTVLVLFVGADLSHRVVQLVLLRRLAGFDSGRYVREAYLRPLLVAMVMGVGVGLYPLCGVTAVAGRWTAMLLTFTATAGLTLAIGLTKSERQALLHLLPWKVRHMR